MPRGRGLSSRARAITGIARALSEDTNAIDNECVHDTYQTLGEML
jgi:hypothetical protein